MPEKKRVIVRWAVCLSTSNGPEQRAWRVQGSKVKARRRCSSDHRKTVIGRASACVMFQDVQFGFATLSALVLQADGAIDLMHAAPIVIFERCGLKTGESYNDPRACWLFAEETEMSLAG